MRLTRRATLRAGGLAAVLGVTSLGGCAGSRGGPSEDPRDWQFDTAAVSETPNRFFASVDHATLRERRRYLPASLREAVTTAPYTPLDAGRVSSIAGVGGVQFGDYGTGSTVTFRSVTALGGFERAPVEEMVRTEGNPESERKYRGLTVFEGVEAADAGGLAGVPGGDTPFTMAALAVGDGSLVVGYVAVSGRNAGMVFAPNVVEATVDAATGRGTRLRDGNPRASRLSDLVGESTLVVGFETDSALLGRYRAAGGSLGRLVAGLRAGAVGVTVDGETSELRLVGLYEDQATANATEAGPAIEQVTARTSEGQAIDRVAVTVDDAAVIVTVAGETRALLDGSGFPSPAR